MFKLLCKKRTTPKDVDMFVIIECSCVIIFFLYIFTVLGVMTSRIIKRSSTLSESLLIGFFAYFLLFQCVALPMVLLKQSVSLLCAIWVGMLIAMVVGSCVFLIKSRLEYVSYVSIRKKKKGDIKCYFVVIAVVIIFSYLVIIQDYWEWDTAFYIGTINTSVKTNTMYLINGESGKPETLLPFRYALSCFYMNSAVFCRITGIEVVYFQKYVIAILCVVLSFIVVYAIGKILFHNNMKNVALFVILFAAINLILGTEYTTSQFLILRAYEAKAFCANVVMPTIFWLLMLLYNDLDHQGNWRLLFLVMLASVPVSMSSILLAPALIGIVILAQIIVDRNWKYLRMTLICMAPNIIYLIVYLLYTLKIFVIKV